MKLLKKAYKVQFPYLVGDNEDQIHHETVYAETPSKARMEAWRKWNDGLNVPLKDLLNMPIKRHKEKDLLENRYDEAVLSVSEKQLGYMKHALGNPKIVDSDNEPYRNYFFLYKPSIDWEDLIQKELATKYLMPDGIVYRCSERGIIMVNSTLPIMRKDYQQKQLNTYQK